MKWFVALCLTAALGLLLPACQNQQKPVKVGFVGCLTGRSTDLGTAGRDGFMLAVKEINSAGGLHGRKIIPLVKDNALEAEKAKRAVRELLEEDVKFVVGPMTSQMAITIVPEMNAAPPP